MYPTCGVYHTSGLEHRSLKVVVDLNLRPWESDCLSCWSGYVCFIRGLGLKLENLPDFVASLDDISELITFDFYLMLHHLIVYKSLKNL